MTGESGRHWFEDMADHMGAAYLRYSFTKGTEQEVDFLVGALGLVPGMRVLDVGCGPGRHCHALAARGIEAVGVDISERFIELATADTPAGSSARFVRGDARALDQLDLGGPFDAAISLCQGAFGIAGPGPFDHDPQNLAGDLAVLRGTAGHLLPGGRLAVSAFSAYFQVRWLESTDAFDAATGVNHERTEIRDPAGIAVETDLWTTCTTPRELRMLAEAAGLSVETIWSVAPGDYAAREPDLEHQEFLLLATTAP